MGEPIQVYDAEGRPMTVYGPHELAAKLAAGEATLNPPPVEPAGASVADSVTDDAPATPVKRTAVKRAKK